MNRNKVVAGALGLVVAAGAVGWVIGARIMSPAEAAARAKPPTASLITVPVDERVLSADIIARGNIGYADPIDLSLAGATGNPDSKQIVTKIPAVGDELKEGSVAIEIAGRPVILLEGELPVYRDMRPGATGFDVLQLEQALVRLGFLDSADETWDNRTGAAVQALYASVGYDANAASDADKASLKAARESVRFANQAVSDADKAIKEAGGATGSALIEAENAVKGAQDALSLARTTRTQEINAAKGEVTVAQTALTNAEQQLSLAEAALSGVPNTDPDYAFLVSERNAAKQTRDEAKVNLDNRNANVTTVTTSNNTLVNDAERNLKAANARLTEAKSPGDLTSLYRARDDARRGLSEANEALVELEKNIGTWLPSGELIFVKMLPVQVTFTNAMRGYEPQGSFMTVSGADISMTVGLQETDAKRIKEGDRVIINEPDLLTEPIESHVTKINASSSGSGRVTVTVAMDNIPPELMGANVRVTIPIESTSGSVLVVPAAALSATADGSTRVEVELADKPGETRFVTVTTGLAADGVVEVRPIDGELAKGDRVVVGQADVGSGEEPSAAPSEDAEG